MEYLVLGIGYDPSQYESAGHEWAPYGVTIHLAHSIDEAVSLHQLNDYVCVSICSNSLDYTPYINALHKVRPVPLIVLSPRHSPEQKAQILHMGAAQLITKDNVIPLNEPASDTVKRYLGGEERSEKLTIITNGDLYFCLEYRTVRVRGQDIILTPIEFEILHLFIMNPWRVFTYDALLRQIWGDEYIRTSKKTVNNRVINLRLKLKTAREFIVNVHGVGYKYVPL